MGAPDFESRRLARLQESGPSWEPLEFPLFARDWLCIPLLPLEAMQAVVAGMESNDNLVIAAAMHAMIRTAVQDTDNWDRAIANNILDAETLSDIAVWLADEYTQRYKLLEENITRQKEYEAEQQRQMSPHPPPDAPLLGDRHETPREKDRRERAFKMAQLMQGGAEIPAPEDTEGYEVWELAQAIYRDGADPEVWGG